MSDESGWVIEHGASEVSRPRYWVGGSEWSYDNLKAIRFCREVDARTVAEAQDDGFPNNYRIAEHGWVDARALKDRLAGETKSLSAATEAKYEARMEEDRATFIRDVTAPSPTTPPQAREELTPVAAIQKWHADLVSDVFSPSQRIERSKIDDELDRAHKYVGTLLDLALPSREELAKVIANPASSRGHIEPLGVDYIIADKVLAYIKARAPEPSEHEKALQDATMHGAGFIKDGKHIDRAEVMAPVEPSSDDVERVAQIIIEKTDTKGTQYALGAKDAARAIAALPRSAEGK